MPVDPSNKSVRLASIPENTRVRDMVRDVIEQDVAAVPFDRKNKEGVAYRKFGEDWIRVAREAGLPVPGSKTKIRRVNYRDDYEHHVNSAATIVRNFLRHESNLSSWMLVGMETVICDRKGMAYPPGAYQTQQRIL